MDVVHRGQPGEEQYGDISSVGESESGQACVRQQVGPLSSAAVLDIFGIFHSVLDVVIPQFAHFPPKASPWPEQASGVANEVLQLIFAERSVSYASPSAAW